MLGTALLLDGVHGRAGWCAAPDDLEAAVFLFVFLCQSRLSLSTEGIRGGVLVTVMRRCVRFGV